ncbi:MAG TPA: peptide-binding protein [Desulfobacterales bacterium]|nr:peptide-binding protein [Desulfobacterales bacterium]
MLNVSSKLKIIISIVFISCLLMNPAYAKMRSIRGDKVQLRSGPGTKYASKWEYGDGFPLKVLSQKGSWVKVKDFENDTGWVFKKYLTSKPHMIVKVNKGKKKKINIRSGPGTKFKIVGRAYYGVVFRTLGQEKGWAKVRHESGLTGWIKRSLLWGY